MTKFEAIKRIKDIQNCAPPYGHEKFPRELKGNVAIEQWSEIDFEYGFEYGEIYGLMEAFDITIEDLYNE